MLFVFIYLHWCPTRFSYHMMSESFTVKRRMPPVVQEQPILTVHLISTRIFVGFVFAQSLDFCVVFGKSLCVLLSFFFWPSYCLPSIYRLRLMIISLVSSNFSAFTLKVNAMQMKLDCWIKVENTEGAIKNGQSDETVSIGYTRRRQAKERHNTICVVHHYT